MSQLNIIIIVNFGSSHVSKICDLIKLINPNLIIRVINWKDFDDASYNNVLGIILSGSPSHLYEAGSPNISNKILTLGIPVLGICYGMQVLAKLSGGDVVKMVYEERGEYKVTIVNESELFNTLDNSITVSMRHSDHVINLPSKYKITSRTSSCIASMEYVDRFKLIHLYAVQFHPELQSFRSGKVIMRNFLAICDEVSHILNPSSHTYCNLL